MIEWASDKNVAISFDKIPSIIFRTVSLSACKPLVESVNEYPFENTVEVKVQVYYAPERRVYNFRIPKGYCYNGATIPRFFWRIIGPPSDPKFAIASCVHDILCENKDCIDFNRKLSSDIFYALLRAAGVGVIKAGVMKNVVDLFQRTRGWNRERA